MAAISDQFTALLAGVIDELEEDTPRLALADWLEEHGDLPRAELIRTQIELAYLPYGAPRRGELRWRQFQLLRDHGPTWRGDPPAGCVVEFQRGLLAVTAEAEALTQPEGEAWWDRLGPWVMRLRLDNCDDAGLRRLVPRFTRIAELSLQYWRHDAPGLTNKGIQSLGALTQLTALRVRSGRVGDAGALTAGRLFRLRELDLRGTQVTDAGVAALGRLDRLRRLVLPFGVTDEGLRALSGLAQLRELDLWGAAVTGPGCRTLAGLPSLRELDLSGTGVTDAGLRHLAASQSVGRLELSGSHVTDVGLQELARMATLECLTVRFCRHLSEAGITDLLSKLPSCQVEYVPVPPDEPFDI